MNLNFTVALSIFWPKCMKAIVLHFIYVYIWPKTADMFLIQLPFIMKSLDQFMNYEFILWWKIKWDVLFQSKALGNFPKETDLLTSWYVLQSWGDKSGSVFVFCELILTPESPRSMLQRWTSLGLVAWSGCALIQCHVLLWTAGCLTDFPPLCWIMS